MKTLTLLASLSISIFVVSLLPKSYAATPVWDINGIEWTTYYRPGAWDDSEGASLFDDIPNSSTKTTPSWTMAGSGGSVTLYPEDHYLNITTSGTESRRFHQSNNWDASSAATVEFTARINSVQDGAAFAGAFLAGNDKEYYSFTIGVTGSGFLKILGTTIDGVLANEFFTVRLTLEGMESSETSVIKVYVNNSTDPSVIQTNLSSSSSTNEIRFGDLSTTLTAQGGSIDWHSVRWLSGQAIAPIPEASTTAFSIGILGLLIWFFRCRNI